MAGSHNEMSAVGEVYATALFALAKEQNELDRVAGELAELSTMVTSHPDIRAFFSSPGADEGRRRELVEKMLRGKTSDLLVNTIQVMHGKGRVGVIPEVERSFHALHDASRGRIAVIVRSAAALSPAQQEHVRSTIKSRTGKEADLIAETDPELLGGMMIRIGDRKFDATVREKLRQMTQAFRSRGAKELQRIEEYVVDSP